LAISPEAVEDSIGMLSSGRQNGDRNCDRERDEVPLPVSVLGTGTMSSASSPAD
jgi:hypothetical protein